MNLILFPIVVSKTTINVDWNKEQVLERLVQYFDEQSKTGVVDRNLHKEKLFEPIVNYMNSVVTQYWKDLEYSEQYPIELSQLWANRFDKGVGYVVHNDSPAHVSVVFYVQKESKEMGNLFFEHPNESVIQTQPLTEQRRHDRYEDINCSTGDLICFPSWLKHGIHPNNTDVLRYSLAGLYELRGLQTFKRMVNKK